jgi:hypothetical protein
MAKIKLTNVRASYAHVFTKHSINGGEPQFSIAILINKNDTENLNKIKAAIEIAKTEGMVKWGGKVPKNLKTPLRDGDIEHPDNPDYIGHYWINANSKSQQPQIVDRKMRILTDPDDFYSGCYMNITLGVYPFAASGNNGIAIGLNNIQKVKDGPRLDGKSTANDDFDEFEDENDFID